MKIGFLHKVNTTPPRSGGSVHTYQVSQYLASQGHQLLALAPEEGLQFHKRLPRSTAGLRQLMREAELLYIRIDGRAGWELATLVPGLRHFPQPIVWEINATFDELTVLQGRKRWRDRAGTPLRQLSAQQVNAALCVSEPLLRYAHDLGIVPAIHVPNGSDPNLFCPSLRDPALFPGLEKQFRILWAGSTQYPWHDFAIVLACAERLQSLDPEIGFAVVGDRPDLPDHQIPGNLHFYPPVPYLEVPRLFASADVGLCLYREMSWSQYGFFFSPLKLFDYAAAGLPVVYTDFPELHQIAGNFGLPVAVGDIDGLSHQLLQLKQQRDLHHRLSHQARRAVLDYYNWGRVGAQTEAVLSALTKGAALPEVVVVNSNGKP